MIFQRVVTFLPGGVIGRSHITPHVRFIPKADIDRRGENVRFVPILLQKSLMACARSDSLVQMRFAAEAGDDGTSQSRPRAAVLFI
jgi:hypothetical protein